MKKIVFYFLEYDIMEYGFVLKGSILERFYMKREENNWDNFHYNIAIYFLEIFKYNDI